MPESEFLSAVASFPANPADGAIDALVAEHFSDGASLAPAIARAYVRRVIAQPSLRDGAYEAFAAFVRDGLAAPRESAWTSSAA